MLSVRREGMAALTGVVVLAASALIGLPAHADTTRHPDQQIAVPAYFPTSDTTSWSEMARYGDHIGFVIANVNSGPGSAVDPGWQHVLDEMYSTGTTPVGYVDTGYLGFTGRSTRAGAADVASWLAQVERDVDSWFDFYGNDIDGIFFDQTESTCGPGAGSDEYVNLYKVLNRYVHDKYPGSLTIDNPGVPVPECYSHAADVLVTFEGDYADYVNPTSGFVPQQWQLAGDSARFFNLVFDVPETGIRTAMMQSKQDNVGTVYLTDRTLGSNPWQAAPSPHYLERELFAADR